MGGFTLTFSFGGSGGGGGCRGGGGGGGRGAHSGGGGGCGGGGGGGGAGGGTGGGAEAILVSHEVAPGIHLGGAPGGALVHSGALFVHNALVSEREDTGLAGLRAGG